MLETKFENYQKAQNVGNLGSWTFFLQGNLGVFARTPRTPLRYGPVLESLQLYNMSSHSDGLSSNAWGFPHLHMLWREDPGSLARWQIIFIYVHKITK